MNIFQRAIKVTRNAEVYFKSDEFADININNVHIILADSRSGSTYFQENLNCHPENCEFGEIYGQKSFASIFSDQRRQINFFSQIVSRSGAVNNGCKITFTQLVRNIESVHFLRAYRQCKYILLERTNIVASTVSLLKAQRSGEFHSRQVPVKTEKITINPSELKMMIEYRKAFRNISINLLDLLNIPYFRVTYEAMVEQPKKVFDGVFNFIGLSKCETFSSLKKSNPTRLLDIIENYSEVKRCFDGTEYAKFFD
nr:sulfotransferase domain-containing protein [uncultured Desulfobacter sp.]